MPECDEAGCRYWNCTNYQIQVAYKVRAVHFARVELTGVSSLLCVIGRDWGRSSSCPALHRWYHGFSSLPQDGCTRSKTASAISDGFRDSPAVRRALKD
jgi:hypothetical protein